MAVRQESLIDLDPKHCACGRVILPFENDCGMCDRSRFGVERFSLKFRDAEGNVVNSALVTGATLAHLTRGMDPRTKALWIWQNTSLRPDPARDTVPSLTRSGEKHHIATHFDGMRPVHTCDCPAGVNGHTCWATHLYKIALDVATVQGGEQLSLANIA